MKLDWTRRINPYGDQTLVRHPYNILSFRNTRGGCKDNPSLGYRHLETFTLFTFLDNCNFEKKINLNECINDIRWNITDVNHVMIPLSIGG